MAESSAHPFRDLVTIYVLWLASMFFAGSLFEVYFFDLGLDMEGIYFADGLWFVAGLLILPFLKGFRTRPFIIAGAVVSFVSALLLLVYPDPNAAYIYRLLLGTTHVFFWMPFNTAYYEFRHQNNAMLGALYYSFAPLLSLFLPGISGSIASTIGYGVLFILAMLGYAAALVMALRTVADREYRFDLPESIRAIRGLRAIMFLEGFSVMAVTSITLPVMLLLFADTPMEFGLFMSLVTVFSLAASFLVSRISDRMQDRHIFLLPSALGFTLATVLASGARDIVVFFIAFGAINFFARLFSPISLALAVDRAESLAGTMAAREFLLNIGRLSSVLIGYLIFVSISIEAALLFQGLAMLLYIPLFERKKAALGR